MKTMDKKKILIVDDDISMRQFLHEVFLGEGFSVYEASQGDEALNLLSCKFADVVVMDLRMPGRDGIETLKEIKSRKIQTKVIIMTGYATIRTAVDTVKLGAFDYIVKPFENDEIVDIVNKAIFESKKPKKSGSPIKEHSEDDHPAGIIGHSPAMKDIFRLIKKVAVPNTTILITGESGTGKTLLAQAIHQLSERKHSPFVTINCAVLPENLLESELFGHEKGSFTGAVAARTGKFELANKGTVFLDEISTLSFQTQAKLLRVIQDKQFEKIGGEHTLEIDVRIVAATNERLDIAVSEGKFREDLFYRLNVVTIEMPSLRERVEDIPALVDYFIKKFNEKLRKNVNGTSGEVMDLLLTYAWPGNVRELENIIERAMILGDDSDIGIECLPTHIRLIRQPAGNDSLKAGNISIFKLGNAIDKAEKDVLIEILAKTNGHRGKAAELLGISRRTLQYKLKKYGMIKEKND